MKVSREKVAVTAESRKPETGVTKCGAKGEIHLVGTQEGGGKTEKQQYEILLKK